MKENWLVSVIVPIYNVEKYLDRCIKSIVEQSYINIEILLVDDGATDSSGKMADVWAKKDSRIKVIHRKNGGLSAARNTGIDAANGEYLLFVDSDDWIHKDMIETLVEKLSCADIVSCGMVKVTNTEEIRLPWFKKEHIFSSDEVIQYLIDNQIFTSHIPRNIYPCYVFETIRFPEGKVFEDIRTIHKLFRMVKKICVIPQNYYFYFERENSISNGEKLQNKIEWYDALNERKQDLKNFLNIESKWKIDSQMAVVMSLAMVQCEFTNEEKNLYEKKLKEIMCFLRKRETWKAVKKYATKTQFIYYLFAREFSFSSNKWYRLIKGK